MEEALRNAPDNSKAHLAVGHIHLEAGRYEPAREHLERAVKLSPGSAEAWINLGSLETALENYAAGLQDFEKALAILPDSTFALLSAGRAHGKLGHALIAEHMLRRVLKIEPTNAEASNQLGLLLSEQTGLKKLENLSRTPLLPRAIISEPSTTLACSICRRKSHKTPSRRSAMVST